ncbi:uncharacterized protein LOC127738866 [Mytilus californianus]|uniref:uncharacterized protein LOC127738866 n=1 Tax=Mytilus californianus TaxID=6549 RepID=UPI0022474FDD|nr:uncharacterized protein LOC127738866 [Mytilus californianus]
MVIMAVKVFLFSAFLVTAECFIRVNNYENSVYIAKGPSGFQKAPPSFYFEPKDYDIFTAEDDQERTISGNEVKKGHLVTFYKYNKDFNPIAVLAFLFTDNTYYNIIRRTMLQV